MFSDILSLVCSHLYIFCGTLQNEVNIEAVAVGAIFSDYQRIRVENV